MKKKIIAFLLVFLMTGAVLVSCKPSDGGNETGGGTDTAVATEPAEENEIDAYVAELAGEMDTEGKTFTYVGHSVNFPTEEKETGDILSDSLYYRQRDLVELFGIDWEPVSLPGGEDTKDRVSQEVTAGGNDFDLVCGGMLTCGQALLNLGVIQPVQDLNYVDFDREWWVQSMRDTFSVKGQLFYLFGPIVPYTYLDTHCVLFNKNLTGMFGINDSDLYDAAMSGKWTLDKMEEVASAVQPVTGSTSGVYRYVHPVGVPFLFACGETITKFDEEGAPYVDETLSLSLSDLSDRLVSFQADETQTAYLKSDEDASKKFGVESVDRLFMNDRGLFYFADTGDVMYLRTQSVEFGILPMPKLNAAQPNYRSYSNPWVGQAVYIPKTVKDLALVDLMAEAMGALSQKYIKDAYYDRMLRTQAIFDMESQQTLEIIFGSKIYDMSVLYSDGNQNTWGTFLDSIDKALSVDNSTFASDYRANARVAKMNIMSLIRTVEKGG
ncbi:MAG: hypothetical protein IKI03_03880 [Clostridia bacterium]|nr:hypothetical protein [Clostridia bacterium]